LDRRPDLGTVAPLAGPAAVAHLAENHVAAVGHQPQKTIVMDIEIDSVTWVAVVGTRKRTAPWRTWWEAAALAVVP
jgi:hypothetical protein